MKKIIDQIYKSFKIISHPYGSIKYLFRKGSSLSSLEILLNMNNYASDVKTIIDVGANQGQFAVASSDIYPAAKIYSFEPIPDVVEIFRKNTESLQNVSLFQSALGNSEGKTSFNYNKYSHASSFLKIHKNQTDLIPETSETISIEIKLDRLDNFISKIDLSSPVLLKLDVQGFEKDVLLGAVNILKKIDYILIEMSFIQMYEKELLFDEMNKYMNSIGFRLKAPLAVFQLTNMQILQMDVLYIRA